VKVYIGPYRYRWISAIHHKYMNWKYDHDWCDSHNAFERFLEKLESFLQTIYNATINQILDGRKDQKVKVRIDNYDVWGMDDTLALIVCPMLKLLKEHKHGSPYVDNADVPEELQYIVTDDSDHDDTIHKRWDWVLNEMIWAFEQKARPGGWESDFYNISPNGNYISSDSVGMQKHQNRMSNGFRLFGRYYEALWD